MKVDIGILTIREDEFRAVLEAFPELLGTGFVKGRQRQYAMRYAEAGDGKYTVGIVRQAEQGNGEAQEAARDMVEDIEPELLLVVGIAGGLPSDDLTLGDVVLSTRVLDFSVEARKATSKTTYAISGGPMARTVTGSIANLAARERDLGPWTEGLPERPRVSWNRQGQLYGPTKWQRVVRETLEGQFGKTAVARPPIFISGPIASSDRLVKDPRVLFPWIETARNLLAVEMESGGVYRTTRERCPMLAIRGISDIVGLKRSDHWTKYACASAAAFARAYLRTRPIEPRAAQAPAKAPVGVVHIDPVETARADETDVLYSNLVPLSGYPSQIFTAPATVNTFKQAWGVLSKTRSRARIPGSWILHNNTIYSFTDPEQSRVREIVDVGGIESHPTSEWADTTDRDRLRLFVQLLNSALRDDLDGKGVWFHSDDKIFAFAGRVDDATPRQYRYQNIRQRSAITVVSHYSYEGKDGRPHPYLRHLAFAGRFRRIDGTFYLEVTPTYRFTTDGKQKDRFHDERLSGIKRLERNRSVLSQVRLWNDVFVAQPDQGKPLLTFGQAPSFEYVPKTEIQLVSWEEYPDDEGSLDGEGATKVEASGT